MSDRQSPAQVDGPAPRPCRPTSAARGGARCSPSAGAPTACARARTRTGTSSQRSASALSWAQLDASIVTLAFPTLQRDFPASLAAVEWVSLAYLLVLISSVIAVGRLSDMVGRKLVYTWGFLLFGLSSLGCGLAPSLTLLIVMRMVQALAAAMLQSNSIALVSTSTPKLHLGKALGVQGAAQALGLAFGPTVGGLLLSVGSWRLIFLVNVPVSVIGFVTGWFLLPRSRNLAERTTLDWAGLAMFVPAISGLLIFLSLGTKDGFLDPVVIATMGASVLLAASFVAHERRFRGTPLVELGLFGNRTYRNAVIGGLIAFLIMFGVMFVVPFLLENARHTSPASAGLLLTVLPLTLGIVAPFAGRIADRLGPHTLKVFGMLCISGGTGLMAIGGGHSLAILLAGLALAGLGLGAFIPSNNSSFMTSVDPRQAGAASGMINLARGLGTSLGVALTGLVFGAVAGADASSVVAGFSAACAMLAGLAVVGALLSGQKGRKAAPPPTQLAKGACAHPHRRRPPTASPSWHGSSGPAGSSADAVPGTPTARRSPRVGRPADRRCRPVGGRPCGCWAVASEGSRPLRRRLDRRHRVVLVNRAADFSLASSYLWAMSGQRRPDQVTRPLQRLQRRSIEVVIGEVRHIDPNKRTVTVDSRDLAADHLVVTLGADWATDRVPGLADHGHTFATLPGAQELAGELDRIERGRIVVVTAAPAVQVSSRTVRGCAADRRRVARPRRAGPGGPRGPQRRTGADAGRRTRRGPGRAADHGRPVRKPLQRPPARPPRRRCGRASTRPGRGHDRRRHRRHRVHLRWHRIQQPRHPRYSRDRRPGAAPDRDYRRGAPGHHRAAGQPANPGLGDHPTAHHPGRLHRHHRRNR